jgi:hypothetical protein
MEGVPRLYIYLRHTLQEGVQPLLRLIIYPSSFFLHSSTKSKFDIYLAPIYTEDATPNDW